VIGGGKEAAFKLNCPNGPVEIRENFGFERKELSEIAAGLDAELRQLCEKWGSIHGNY
jgi:hypothetical protein